MKKIIIVLSVLVLLLIVWQLVRGKKEVGFKVVAEKASLRDITELVSASGKIYPEVEVKISPDVSGEVIEMSVELGDTVIQGQLLCRINPELYESALEQMKATVNNSRASLANTESQLYRIKALFKQQEQNFKRQQKLYAEKVISDSEFEAAQSQFLAAKADLESGEKSILAAKYSVQSAEARLEESRRNFGRTSIYAPINGIVTAMNIEQGERVVGTSQMAGTEIMRISQLDRMEIRVDVNENDIIRIKKGDTAQISVDAYPKLLFKGKVSQVARSIKTSSVGASSDAQAVSFEVRIQIDSNSFKQLVQQSGQQAFWQGMTGSVDVFTKMEKSVLTVPIGAVTMREVSEIESDKEIKSSAANERVEVVFVVNKDKAEARRVKTGIQDGNFIQILSGVKEGEKIISGPYGVLSVLLKNGSSIKLTTQEELFKD
jgi:HlyD family secretion protein